MATPTMTYQLDAAAAHGAEGFVRLVSSADDRTVIAHATASAVAVAGERTCKAGRARSVSVTTANTSTTVTGVLRSTDVGKPISGTGIPANAYISAVGSTTFTLSAAATATGTVTATVDTDGLLVFLDLNPNSGASDDVIDDPAGTVWEIVVTYPKAATPDPVYFTAPDLAGRYSITDYVTSRPGDLPSPGAGNTVLAGDVTGTAGSNTIGSQAVTAGKLASDAVTTVKILDDAVTTAKIAAGNVTATELASEAATRAKLSSELDSRDRSRQHTGELNAWNTALASGTARVAIVGDSEVVLAGFNYVDEIIDAYQATPMPNEWMVMSAGNPVAAVIGGYTTVEGTSVEGSGGTTNFIRRMAVGDECTFTASGDAMRFQWRASAGSLEIRVDGVLETTESCAADGTYLWTGSYGSHDVTVTAITDTCDFDDVTVYPQNRTSGVQVLLYGNQGDATSTVFDNTDLIDRLVVDDPHLVIMATGINDFGAGDAAAVAASKADVLAAGTTVAANLPNASLAKWIPPSVLAHQPFAAFATAYRELCRDEGWLPIDAFEDFGGDDYDPDVDPLAFYTDGVHFSTTGAQKNSQLVLGKIAGDQFTPGASRAYVDAEVTAKTVDVVSNVAADRILGRITSGSGNSEELTADQVTTLLALTAGDIEGSGTITHPGGGYMALSDNSAPFSGIPIWDFGVFGEAYARFRMSPVALVFGSGTATRDVGIARDSAGKLRLNDASTGGGELLTTVTPSTNDALTRKGYVDTYTLNAKTTDYTLVIGDARKLITVNSASNLTVTIPTNASVAFTTGTRILVTRLGAGTVTIAPVSGTVTVRSRSSLLDVDGQYGVVELVKIATNEWLVSGDLA